MEIIESPGGWIARLDPGEELPRDLLAAVGPLEFGLLAVSGIGAVRMAILGYYDLHQNRYVETVLDENLEVVSLQGNITRVDGEPFLHAHVLVSRRDGQVLGGHLMSARVSVTVELVLAGFDATASRQVDPRFGLKLLRLWQLRPVRRIRPATKPSPRAGLQGAGSTPLFLFFWFVPYPG